MTQTQINDRISYELAGWGSGFYYDWTIRRSGGSIYDGGAQQLRSRAEEGDKVEVRVFVQNPGQEKMRCGTETFVVKPLSPSEKKALSDWRSRSSPDAEKGATYEFRRRCMKAMHDGRSNAEMIRDHFGDDHPAYLDGDDVQEIVSQVWFWAGLRETPTGSVDGRIGDYNGKNYSQHGTHGKNPVVIRDRYTSIRTVYHECAHALLRALDLNATHNENFRMLELQLYDAWLPGFELDVIEAKAIARGLSLSVNWNFDIDQIVYNYTPA